MMTRPRSRGRVTLAISLIAAVLLPLVAHPARAADSANPGIVPPNAYPQGQTYGQWNARWWQWMFSVPASRNQALQTGAVDCGVGQSGSVWFLAGSFNSGSITRSCTVPAGTMLFVPLVNTWVDNVCNTPPLTVDGLRAAAANAVLPPAGLHASIDGQSLSNLASYRAVSPVFSYTLPPSPDNMIDAVFGVSLPGDCWPSLTVSPAVADGFYIMLAPLSVGVHRVTFGGVASGGALDLDVTYNLTVRGH